MAFIAYLFLAILAVASAAPESRIVGGDHVTIQEFPYVVAYTYHYPGIGITIQRCVGSLISSFHVLTTAFCFTGGDLGAFQIRAGSTNSLTGGTVVNIARVVSNPGYVANPRENDIAVTFLESALGITDSINILFLPPQNFFIPDGQAVKIVSWGFESEGGAQLTTLKTVSLNKISVEACQAAFAEDQALTVTDNVICATATGKGMCFGDSGAPMVINQVVVGTSSYYSDCDSDVYPDVFTRIDRFTNWILEVATASPGARSANIQAVPKVM